MTLLEHVCGVKLQATHHDDGAERAFSALGEPSPSNKSELNNLRPQDRDGLVGLLCCFFKYPVLAECCRVGLFPCQLTRGGVSLVLSYLSTQDVGSERLEHSGAAHITNTEQGPWKGQNGQPVNGVLSRYGW